MTNFIRPETLVNHHDLDDIRDILSDLGHDIDVFDTDGDFKAYLLCLADGTCGSEGRESYLNLCRSVSERLH
jgi:hypothetical protein